MLIICIVCMKTFSNALKLMNVASATTKDSSSKDGDSIALIFDPYEETALLKTHVINSARMSASFEASVVGTEKPLWVEVEVALLLKKLKHFEKSTHLRIEIDSATSEMYISGGFLRQADLVSPEDYFEEEKKTLVFKPAIKILNTLSNYESKAISCEEPSVALTKIDQQLLKRLFDFNQSLAMNENDTITLEIEDEKLVVYSTHFYGELCAHIIQPDFSTTFGGHSYNVFQQIVNAVKLKSEHTIKLRCDSESVVVSSDEALAILPSKALCERPSLIRMPNFRKTEGVSLDVKSSRSALSEVDALQKKHEDVVRVLLKNDDVKSLAFEVESYRGYLASEVNLSNTNLDAGFELRVLRAPLRAALQIFNDTNTVYLFGLDSKSDYFFVTDEGRTRFASFEKLSTC